MFTQKTKSLFFTMALVMLTCFLASCGGGLPKELKKQAKDIPNTIKYVDSTISQDQKNYDQLTKSGEFKPMERFAQKENWAQNFQKAKAELERASGLYKKELKPLISKNKFSLAPQVTQQMERINTVISGARELSKYPLQRFAKIQDNIKNIDSLKNQSEKNLVQLTGIVTDLKKNEVAKAKNDFPDNVEKIDAKFASFLALQRQSEDHLKVINKVASQHQSNQTADYAAFTDGVDGISQSLETAKEKQPLFKKAVAGLYLSYTKVLKDMKEEYSVTVKRESWNENSDYYNPKFATFTRPLSPETYEYLSENEMDSIAKIQPGWGGSKLVNNIGAHWPQLKIEPTAQWPGMGHNAASFYVDSFQEAYYHKYLLEENGETKETGWEKVNASFFDQNLEFMGMAILSKPYGVFEEDQLAQAAPPGMAYVGNPKYGEWKKDEKGESFWGWYGKWAFFSNLFFFPPTYFYYNSWRGWNRDYRHKKPYFGKTKKGFQKYGTYGNYIKKSPRFQSTNFAKSGGLKTSAASVRGAGSKLRGGGPKAKGK
ncbi:MAG: hypothetical protein GY729_21075 [Desulfobacteraceae bacterium]|nr:hypothetical protein [Desulfobacteraceae bacterium]